ncbi:hypothetical protein P5673_010764 [Acropora cervicornis]|uniref:Uncharacterized protein n=1 Tax=Acropora cervicornis TaxID=6130 RepID=A0AAD9QQH7_ACRCE|nr:hypothetical protein P5673_010764 [Acropora cervicornis]
MCFVRFWESGINNITTSEVVPLGNQAGTKYKPKIDPSKLAPIEENNTFRYAVVSQYTHISVVQRIWT